MPITAHLTFNPNFPSPQQIITHCNTVAQVQRHVQSLFPNIPNLTFSKTHPVNDYTHAYIVALPNTSKGIARVDIRMPEVVFNLPQTQVACLQGYAALLEQVQQQQNTRDGYSGALDALDAQEEEMHKKAQRDMFDSLKELPLPTLNPYELDRLLSRGL